MIRKIFFPMLGAVSLVLGVACGGGGGGSEAQSGTVSVKLVSDPSTDWSRIDLNIRKVEIKGDSSGWVTIVEAKQDQIIPMMRLVNGVLFSLADKVSVPVDHYTQARLSLGSSGNQGELAGDLAALPSFVLPGELQSGIVWNDVQNDVDTTVSNGGSSNIVIGFDGNRSIQTLNSGGVTSYAVWPLFWARNADACGTISGKLTDETSSAALSGAFVTAQTRDSDYIGHVLRTVKTDSEGNYTLDFLPLGSTYYVVSQPLVGSQAYNVAVSEGQVLSAGVPAITYNASFTLASKGSVHGEITGADVYHSSFAELRQMFTVGSEFGIFVVQTSMATKGASSDVYTFASVPSMKNYRIRATWVTKDANGNLRGNSPPSSLPFDVGNSLYSVPTIAF